MQILLIELHKLASEELPERASGDAVAADVKNFSGSEIDITSHDQDTAKHKAGVKNLYAGKDVKGTGKEVNLLNAEDKAANATDTRTEKKPNLEVTGVTKEKGEDMEENLGLT
ncbi:unnamed protein product [Sphagnum troendelagicum]